MKTEITEWQHGLNITIEPETVEECATLLRFARNASTEKPRVNMSFKKGPVCYIGLSKRKYTVQYFTINPKTK